MIPLAALALLLSVTSVATPPPRPSLAVLGFTAREGVTVNLAEILAENAATALRNSKRFSRVVSTADVMMLMSLEAQKQMLNCDSASCVAEIAGALGTDLVCAGTVAQVGSVVVLNARIVEAGNGHTLASVGRNIQSAGRGGEKDMGVVLLELPGLIRELLASLDDATLVRVARNGQQRPDAPPAATSASATPTPATPTPATPTPATATVASSGAPASTADGARPTPAPQGPAAATPEAPTDPGSGPRPLRVALWGVGGVGAAVCALVLLAGLGGVVTAVAMPVTSWAVPGSHRAEGALQAGFLGALLVAGAALPTVLLGAGASGVMLLAGGVLG